MMTSQYSNSTTHASYSSVMQYNYCVNKEENIVFFALKKLNSTYYLKLTHYAHFHFHIFILGV